MSSTTDEFTSTPSVERFYLLNPQASDIHIKDIAYGLSRCPRFGGFTKGEPLSVAEHSIYVNDIIREREPKNHYRQMVALLHDASETYIGDVVRPLKYGLAMTGYRELENKITKVIFDGLNLPQPTEEDWAAVKVADDIMLITERNAVHCHPNLRWQIDTVPHAIPRKMEIQRWFWWDANFHFLQQYRLLKEYLHHEAIDRNCRK